jgi:hypothetical protein
MRKSAWKNCKLTLVLIVSSIPTLALAQSSLKVFCDTRVGWCGPLQGVSGDSGFTRFSQYVIPCYCRNIRGKLEIAPYFELRNSSRWVGMDIEFTGRPPVQGVLPYRHRRDGGIDEGVIGGDCPGPGCPLDRIDPFR